MRRATWTFYGLGYGRGLNGWDYFFCIFLIFLDY